MKHRLTLAFLIVFLLGLTGGLCHAGEGDPIVEGVTADSISVLGVTDVTSLDATTEATIETALDTLPNVVTIQGQTVTLSGGLAVESDSVVNQDLTSDADVTFNDLTLSSPSNIYALDHDSFSGYVANEHIDWTSDQGATNIDDGNITKTAITQNSYTYADLSLPIDDTPVDGVTTEPISSNWAYDHLNDDDVHTGTQVSIQELGTATYDDLNDFFKLFISPGRISGGAITAGAGGTINIAGGTGVIRTSDDDTAQLYFCDWDASNGVSVTTDTVLYVGVEYDSVSGAAQITTQSTNVWNYDTEFPLGSVINQAGDLYILNNPWWTADAITNGLERHQAAGYMVRDEYEGGLMLSVTATRYPYVTAGKTWSRFNEFDISVVDCSAPTSDTFYMFYRNGVDGLYTRSVATSQYPVTQYDPAGAGLVDLDNNKYANWWLFIDANSGQLMMIYPQAQYNTAAEAEDESIPTFKTAWYEHGVLIGRIIFKKSVDTPIAVESAFDISFKPSVATVHNYLAGLQGGTADQYYHLTSDDYGYLTDANAQLAALHTDGSPTFDDLTISNPSNIYALSHDSFAAFVADEHVAHSDVTITAGAGMTGGGTIAATRTLNVIAGTGITVNADSVETKDSEIVHDNLSGFVSNEHIDHTAVSITAGTGLTGGGDISSTRTLAVDGILEDLDTLGPPASDGQMLVATGAGAYAHESGATLRTSIGCDAAGTDNSTDVTLNASATTGGMSISTQEISNRAATNAQTGYATAAHIQAIEANTNLAHTQGTDTTLGTQTEDLDMGGYYAVNLQNIPDILSGGPGYWFGGDDYIRATDNDNLDVGTNDFTIISQFNVLNNSNYDILVCKRDATTGYLVALNPSGAAYIELDDDTTPVTGLVSASGLDDGKNHVLGVVFDRSATVSAYVDGLPTGLTQDISSTTLTVNNGDPFSIGANSSTLHNLLLGSVSRTLLFNLALDNDDPVDKAIINGGAVPFKYLKNDTDKPGELRNSGNFVIGAEYIITTRTDGDFQSAGAADDVVGTRFTATATAAGVLDAGDTATRLGAVLQLEPEGIGTDEWLDSSGNDLHGTVSGATAINSSGIHTDGTDSYIDGDLTVDGTTINMVTSGTILTVGVGADNGTVSAGVFTDRTKFYEGNALAELSLITGKGGQLDHDTLPEFVQEQVTKKFTEVDTQEFELVEVTKDLYEGYEVEEDGAISVEEKLKSDKWLNLETGKVYQRIGTGEVAVTDGKVIETITTRTKHESVETERNLGASISMNVVAIQQLYQLIQDQQKEIEGLKARLN